MPTIPATFENFQLEATDYRQFLTQAEQLTARGVPDPLAPVVRRLDMNTDGDGFDPDQRFSEKMADGLDAPLSIALVGDEGTFGGNLTARYRELRLDMPDLCGIDNMVSKTTLADGRIKEVWRFPEGPRKIRTQTAWFGIKERCWLLQYGKLQTWVLESERTGETGGNKSYHFNAAIRNQLFPNFTAQNSRYTVVAANVTGNLETTYLLPGSSTPRTVTMAIGDTALQSKGKYEAFGDGVTVNVVGTIATGTGEVHTLTGTGNTVSIYGGAVTINTATATLTIIQNAIRGLSGRATATVTGTITKPGPVGANLLAGKTLVGYTGANYTTLGDGNLASAANQFGSGEAYYSYTPPTDITISRVRLYVTSVASVSSSVSIRSSYGGASLGSTAMPIGTTGWVDVVLSSPTTFGPSNPLVIQADGQMNTELREIEAYTSNAVTVGALALTITYNVSDGNVGDIETTPIAGYTGTNTPPGGASGTVTVEFTAPANTRVQMSKTSGHGGYTVTETQLGNDGAGAMEIGGPEIQPTHWLVYKGATLAELNAIDMGNATTPRDTTTSKLVRTAHGQTISFENLAQAVYLEDGKVNPGSHMTRRPTVTSSLTVNVQQAGNVDYAEDIYATENFGGCGVNPFWLRYSARCSQDEIWIDGKWARNQTAAHPVSEGLAQWQFPLTRIRDRSGSLFITFIYPAS